MELSLVSNIIVKSLNLSSLYAWYAYRKYFSNLRYNLALYLLVGFLVF